MRVAFHKDRVMVLAGKPCAGEGDKVRAHIGRRTVGDVQQAGGRGQMGQRRRIAIGFDHRVEAVVAPGINDQVGAGTDYPGHAHYQRPGQGDDAQQVVQVEPAQAPGFVGAHRGEFMPTHKRQVQHRAGDDRQYKQNTHKGQQQLAGQTGEHVYVQAQNEHHQAAVGRRHFQRFAGAGIEHKSVRRIRFGASRGGHDGKHRVGLVVITAEVLHHLMGAMGFGRVDQLLQVQVRRVGRHLPQFGTVAQQVVDFMGKNQRQAGQCQHQQKCSANQAGPGVDKGPATDRFAFHGNPKLTGRLAVTRPAGDSVGV